MCAEPIPDKDKRSGQMSAKVLEPDKDIGTVNGVIEMPLE